ncbi:hypothetical protein [Aquamicrobium sp.]|uniref:hypothetical protein n=1 Tax=Aquamicrobium sp. TaxID=1872579 RepID=UPI0025828B9C|nr:hypothetical protein [Aquamicrobium sp.]MCK9549179.1 hypothetical protein [Aquamicrobium sp.]
MSGTKKIDDGGPAFPTEQGHCPDGTWNQSFEPGMSLRDWFAGQALAGMLTGQNVWHGDSPRLIAVQAYEIADRMIAERAKVRGEKP